MSDLRKAYRPIPLRDDVPAVCLAIAILGLAIGGYVLSIRATPYEPQLAMSDGASDAATAAALPGMTASRPQRMVVPGQN